MDTVLIAVDPQYRPYLHANLDGDPFGDRARHDVDRPFFRPLVAAGFAVWRDSGRHWAGCNDAIVVARNRGETECK